MFMHHRNKTLVIILLIMMFFLSCASGPKDTEIIDLVKKERLRGDFLLDIKIVKKGGARKPEGYNITVYPVTVSYSYITEGMLYGWVAGTSVPYFEQYYEDYEWYAVTEFLIGKNQFNEWDIIDSRNLEYKQVQPHKRPKSKSMEEFYKDRVKTLPAGGSKSGDIIADSIALIEKNCKELKTELEKLKPYVRAYDSLNRLEKELNSLISPVKELNKNRFLFAHILEEIAKNLPEFTWLTSLSVSQSNVKIIGITASNLLVADFMNRLEESPYISNVDLTVLERKTIEKQEMMEFTLTANVSNETTAGRQK